RLDAAELAQEIGQGSVEPRLGEIRFANTQDGPGGEQLVVEEGEELVRGVEAVLDGAAGLGAAELAEQALLTLRIVERAEEAIDAEAAQVQAQVVRCPIRHGVRL